jgi:hypothetical protein
MNFYHPRFTHALKLAWSRGWFSKTKYEKQDMKTTTILAFIWVFLFPFISFSQSNQEEALLQELSLSYSLLQEETSAFLQTTKQKVVSEQVEGRRNSGQVTQQGYQNDAFIWQMGSHNKASLNQQGESNQSATLQKGNKNSYSLLIEGDSNVSAGAQFGNHNEVKAHLKGNNLIHEVYQIGHGNQVVQEGVQTLSIKIKQKGNGLKAIVK